MTLRTAQSRHEAPAHAGCRCPEHSIHVDPWMPYGGRGHKDPQPGSLAVQLQRVTVRYDHCAAPAISDVSIGVNICERVALIGPNGAGKSTILKTIAGLLQPVSGTVSIFGNRVGACHHRTAYLAQRADLDWRFPMTVFDLVMTGRYVHLGWLKRPGQKDRDAVWWGMERLRIADLAERQIGELSGGQQQRTLLARAIVQEASLFLLDEPLNAVDEATREIVDEVLRQETRNGSGLLAATHDPGHLSKSFDRAVYLRQGCIIEGNCNA